LPPSGFHRIRHYGLLANANRKHDIPTVRELLHEDVRQHQKKYRAHRCSFRKLLSRVSGMKEVKDTEGHRCNCREKQESGIKAEMMHDRTGNRLTEGRSDADRRANCPEGDVESTKELDTFVAELSLDPHS
jgi:hypothetical protein